MQFAVKKDEMEEVKDEKDEQSSDGESIQKPKRKGYLATISRYPLLDV